MRRIRIFSLVVVILFPLMLNAQGDTDQLDVWKLRIARSLVSEGFDVKLANIDIISHHFSAHNEVNYVYYRQKYNGIEIYKAIGNVAFKEDISLYKSSRLVKEAVNFVNTKATFGPELSVQLAADHLHLPLAKAKGHLSNLGDSRFSLSKLPYAKNTTSIRKVWAKSNDGNYVLSWAIEMTPSVNSDHWEIVVNGNDGSILSEVNNTVYCQIHNHEESKAKRLLSKVEEKIESHQHQVSTKSADGSRYRVFQVPAESPALGSHNLIQEPADPLASPFGWHDINGIDGPEFNTLQGNNVHAYPDTAASNAPAMQELTSIGGLTFDFPFDPDASPEDNIRADMTNIFYWTNFMHDWSFNLGFNETAGNFQQTNYSNLGNDGDEVFAETLDGSDTNNANFSAPRDGTNGRMQMYKWTVGDDFDILSPSDISGTYTTGNSSFGPVLQFAVQEEIVLVNDSDGVSTDACQPITNGTELAGKIALIDRGDCDFSFKVFAAQEAGAVGCLICDNVNDGPLVNMAAGENADQVRIPSLFLSRSDCTILKERLSEGVIGRFNETRELSSAFDNGIVVHEYGHGISLRLTGGSSTSACLNNDEQMGEGWSDFFTLAITQRPGDNRFDPRPIGTYVLGESLTGRGIRRYPYNTDINTNPQIHSHVRFSFRPHDIGEIWTAALWDMYWDLIDRDGYDASWKDPSKGNVLAMQLVFDGLKLQECDPSLVEGRDAILQADQLNNGGVNACLIWNAFARRGLGIDAKSNDSDQRYDNVDGFEIPSSCNGELTIEKEMSPIVDPGVTIEVVLDVENFQEPLDKIVITDEIPPLTSFINVDDNVEVTQDGNILSFNIGSLDLGESKRIRYTLNSENVEFAQFDLYDDLEGAIQFERTTTNNNVRGWALTTALSTSGLFALRVSPDTLGNESFATRTAPIEVSPATRLVKFNHKYDMDLGIDGGIVEVSTDQGSTWEGIAAENYLVNGMPDVLNNCLNNCPTPDFFYRNTHPAFTGSRDWHTSVIDLSNYMGQTIFLRFNHISLTFRDSLTRQGWIMDDFELLERKELSGEACITRQGNSLACVSDFTLVNSNAGKVPATKIETDQFLLTLSPNPTDDFLNLNLVSKERFAGVIRFVSTDGKIVLQESVNVVLGENSWQRDVSALNPGIYFVELSDQRKNYTLTFIKQ